MINAATYRILIVEDDPVIRKFLVLAIDQSPQLSVVATADSVERGSAMLDEQEADVLLADLGLPDGSGITLIRQARSKARPLECMVITMYDDNDHLFRALEAGATGYLLKDALPDNIADSVLKLLAGGSPISPAIARSLLTRFCKENPVIKPEVQLTEREIKVLELMAQGLLRKEIAHRLTISQHTINTHIRNIYHKLEVGSNIEAINKAQRMDVIPR